MTPPFARFRSPFTCWPLVLPLVLVLGTLSCQPARRVQTAPTSDPRVVIAPPSPPPGELLGGEPPLLRPAEVRAALPGNPFENRRISVDLAGGDVKEVLRALVRGSDLGLVIDSGVEGTVPVMDLKESRLGDILGFILPPLGLSVEWQGSTLHVRRIPHATRYFRFDYLAMVRKGSRQVSFSTRSNEGGGSSGGGGGNSGSGGGSSGSGGSAGGGGGSASGGGGQNQTTSNISVSNENAVWNTFIESLKTLVFGNLQLPASQTAARSSTGTEGRIAPFSFADGGGRSLIITPETGMVVITAPEAEIARAATFIERFQGSAQRQVWIEARILEVNLNKAYQLGVDWGAVVNRGGYYGILNQKRTLSSPALSFSPGSIQDQDLSSSYGTFQMAVSNNVVDTMIDALSRQGQLKVLASPKISTMNNEKAVIRVVREEAFFNLQTQVSQGTGGNVTAPTINVQIVPIGIVMDILPQINDRGEILLAINPDISELLEVKRFEVQGAMATQPVIDRRSIDTLARLRDGQTLVIAGILKEKKNEVIRGVPFLSKIPLLGNLFRRTEQRSERTELVILITPTVVAGRTADQLTRQERESIERAMRPNRLGDVFPLKEGVSGEIDPLKRDPSSQGSEW